MRKSWRNFRVVDIFLFTFCTLSITLLKLIISLSSNWDLHCAVYLRDVYTVEYLYLLRIQQFVRDWCRGDDSSRDHLSPPCLVRIRARSGGNEQASAWSSVIVLNLSFLKTLLLTRKSSLFFRNLCLVSLGWIWRRVKHISCENSIPCNTSGEVLEWYIRMLADFICDQQHYELIDQQLFSGHIWGCNWLSTIAWS